MCEASILLTLSATRNCVPHLNKTPFVDVHFDDTTHQVHVYRDSHSWASTHLPSLSISARLVDLTYKVDPTLGDVSPPSLRMDFRRVGGVPLLLLALFCLMWKTGALCLAGDDVIAFLFDGRGHHRMSFGGFSRAHARYLPRWPIIPG